ncbi:MAG: Flp pilus assembly protein CpaB [Lentisphaeria bacterium]|nr:Flp pilus assembly protein CpaB [Lentisphaeria bacterium]
MKNSIPLILAVLLGLAAVFAVSRIISTNTAATEEKVKVVAATRDLAAGEVIAEGFFMPREIPLSALPAQAIRWNRSSMIVGQKLKQPVQKGNYIFIQDVGLSQGMSNVVGEGEWAVAIQIADRAMASLLQSGDEVAIIGTFKLDTRAANGVPAGKKDVTMVLFPKVRVMEVPAAKRGQNMEGVIIVLLPPQQAQALIAASRVAELTPVLRRGNDPTALNRMDAGMVTPETFSSMVNDLEVVKIPQIPKK